MTTGFSTMTAADAKKEISGIKATVKKISASKKSARSFLVKHGFLTKKGQLTARYK